MVAYDRQQEPHVPRVTFFRYAEALVMFQEVNPDVKEALDYERMRAAFQESAGVELAVGEDPFGAHNQFTLGKAVTILRSGQPERLLRRIALAPWQKDLENVDGPNDDPDGLDEANKVVPRDCQGLNDAAKKGLSVGNWRLVAATPHWRVMTFQYGEGGGPGGRPIKGEPRYFRASGDPENVKQAVKRCIGDAVSDDVRGSSDIRVAILDSWPMDNEVIGIGDRPTKPLNKIRSFMANHPGAQANGHLQAAARGYLVNPANFRDYVSAHPTKNLPVRHHNWKTHELEPFYDVSDHGLFIAGMIKDIAPDTELAVYRVLNDYGTTDLHTLVRAVEDAIMDAREAGKRLVINMSLGFAPPLRVIKELLADPFAKQEAAAWHDLLHRKGHSDDQDGANPLLDAQALEADGLVELDPVNSNAKHLKGPLALVDFLFRLDGVPNVFVVASAGNDSHRPAKRLGPRLPAFVEGVLGVSAAGASFSNRDDIEPARDDAVAAYGGDAATPTGGNSNDTMHGPSGPAIAEKLPPPTTTSVTALPLPGTPNNSNGWAQWAGTSFAAPIATGLAACIWAERPAFSPVDFMKAIVGPLPPGARREIELMQM